MSTNQYKKELQQGLHILTPTRISVEIHATDTPSWRTERTKGTDAKLICEILRITAADLPVLMDNRTIDGAGLALLLLPSINTADAGFARIKCINNKNTGTTTMLYTDITIIIYHLSF